MVFYDRWSFLIICHTKKVPLATKIWSGTFLHEFICQRMSGILYERYFLGSSDLRVLELISKPSGGRIGDPQPFMRVRAPLATASLCVAVAVPIVERSFYYNYSFLAGSSTADWVVSELPQCR